MEGTSKEIYSINELIALGYSGTRRRYDGHARGQNFATTPSGGGEWLINRADYDKWLRRKRSC